MNCHPFLQPTKTKTRNTLSVFFWVSWFCAKPNKKNFVWNLLIFVWNDSFYTCSALFKPLPKFLYPVSSVNPLTISSCTVEEPKKKSRWGLDWRRRIDGFSSIGCSWTLTHRWLKYIHRSAIEKLFTSANFGNGLCKLCIIVSVEAAWGLCVVGFHSSNWNVDLHVQWLMKENLFRI